MSVDNEKNVDAILSSVVNEGWTVKTNERRGNRERCGKSRRL
jgi:hypothetical protein